MRLPLFIARRYLFSRKSQNAVNIISGFSVVAVSIGTLALVVVLSAFNGLENLVISLFDAFDPDIKITAVEGKTFNASSFPKEAIQKLDGLAYYVDVIEENALLEYRKQQYIGTIKGVEDAFLKMTGLDTMMTAGILQLEEHGVPQAIVGQGIANSLGISVNDQFNPLTVYMPKRGLKKTLNPNDAFITRKIHTSGVFSIQKDFDIKFVLVPLSFARDLLQYDQQISAVEIAIKEEANMHDIQEEIRQIVGSEFNVANRYEQHDFLYKIMKTEKWAVFLILTFILIIATFNSIASLTMIIMDKKKDIGILWGMGAEISLIKRIFFNESMMITFLGNISGLFIGSVICYLQQKYGLIKLGENFVTDSIPVSLQAQDLVYIFLTVTVIGLLASWLPIGRISTKSISIS
ncbi:MAG TPA: ABC transporter permease [Flavobacteriales bacterium]|nr:ABC transporter permease [Flavobacteriales bacterium]HIA13180.1 ABC transporter permease [Flavobacteriales bacterium]